MNIYKEAGQLSREVFDESFFWDSNQTSSPIGNPQGLAAFEYFQTWRRENPISPTHLALYEFLHEHKYDWGQIRSRELEDQTYFLQNDRVKLAEINRIVIGMTFAHVCIDNRIDFIMKDSCLATIERELNPKINKDDVSQSHDLECLYQKFESIKIVGIQQTNDDLFADYFERNKKER